MKKRKSKLSDEEILNQLSDQDLDKWSEMLFDTADIDNITGEFIDRRYSNHGTKNSR